MVSPLPKEFTVRVYAGAGHPLVVTGGVHPLMGVYIDAVAPQGTGYHATPGRRVGINPSELVQLPPGSDADFEIRKPFPVDTFKSLG